MAAKLTFVEQTLNRQPPSGARIDWTNPLTRGLTFLSRGSHDENVVRNAPISLASLSGTVTSVVTKHGLGSKFSNATTRKSLNTNVFKNGDCTAMFVGSPSASASFGSYAISQAGSVEINFGVNFDASFNTVSGRFILSTLQPGYRSSVYVDGVLDGTPSCYLIGKSTGSGFAYKNGRRLTTTITGDLPPLNGLDTDTLSVGGMLANGSYPFDYPLNMVAVWSRQLTLEEASSVTLNPWQLFESEQIHVFAPVGTGPVTHPTSGDVVGNTATVTGTATRSATVQTHPSTGAVVGNTATVSGTALRYRAHATTGVVTGLTSNVTGTAKRYRLHTTTGAVTGLTSTVTGTATNEPAAGVHETDGVVTGTTGAVTGSALHIGVHRTTGVVAGYQGAVTGTAKNYTVHETTGVLSGFSAEVVGAAQRSGAVIVHGTSGVLAGYDSVVTGAATNMGGMTLTPADIQAIVAAIKAEIMPVNIVRVNNIDVDGTGVAGDEWGPV
jgi:hypothetical protein